MCKILPSIGVSLTTKMGNFLHTQLPFCRASLQLIEIEDKYLLFSFGIAFALTERQQGLERH
jgi:hypothetical protein